MYDKDVELTVTDNERAAFKKLRFFFSANYSLTWNPEVSVEDWVLMTFHGDTPDDECEAIQAILKRHLALEVDYEPLSDFLNYDATKPVLEHWNEPISVGAFAVWILQRYELVSIEPVNICGRTCAAGGVFLALEQLARRQNPEADQIGPSTRLLDVMKLEELMSFWTAASVTANQRLPGFRGHGCLACLATAIIAMVVPAVTVWTTINMLILPGSVVLFLSTFPGLLIALLPYGFFVMFLGERLSPALYRLQYGRKQPEWFLPTGIKTFGDLARRIAAIRG